MNQTANHKTKPSEKRRKLSAAEFEHINFRAMCAAWNNKKQK